MKHSHIVDDLIDGWLELDLDTTTALPATTDLRPTEWSVATRRDPCTTAATTVVLHRATMSVMPATRMVDVFDRV